MSQEDLPSGITKFIRGRITSVTQLEILLLLFSDLGKEWTARAVSARLLNNENSVIAQLAKMESLRLIRSRKTPEGSAYRIDTEASGLVQQLRELADAYARWRFRVIDAIFADRNENLRNFSDSFRLRREDKDV